MLRVCTSASMMQHRHYHIVVDTHKPVSARNTIANPAAVPNPLKYSSVPTPQQKHVPSLLCFRSVRFRGRAGIMKDQPSYRLI